MEQQHRDWGICNDATHVLSLLRKFQFVRQSVSLSQNIRAEGAAPRLLQLWTLTLCGAIYGHDVAPHQCTPARCLLAGSRAALSDRAALLGQTAPGTPSPAPARPSAPGVPCTASAYSTANASRGGYPGFAPPEQLDVARSCNAYSALCAVFLKCASLFSTCPA